MVKMSDIVKLTGSLYLSEDNNCKKVCRDKLEGEGQLSICVEQKLFNTSTFFEERKKKIRHISNKNLPCLSCPGTGT